MPNISNCRVLNLAFTPLVLLFLCFNPLIIAITGSESADKLTNVQSSSAAAGWGTSKSPACWETSRLKGNLAVLPSDIEHLFDRIVVVGDIHGNLPGLVEVLQKAQVISKTSALSGSVFDTYECAWLNELEQGHTDRVLLIQTGDVVDRGRFTTECVRCLRRLQETAPKYSSRVVRLLGNHDLMWLSADYEYHNKETDTPEKIHAVAKQMIVDVLDHRLLGAYSVTSFQNIPMLFSHAGLRKNMKDRLQAAIQSRQGENKVLNTTAVPMALQFANYINDVVYKDLEKCKRSYPRFDRPGFNATIYCFFKGDIYSAGSDRGGDGVGGVFWTDYTVLTDDAQEVRRRLSLSESGAIEHVGSTVSVEPEDGWLWPFSQVVGHTMAKSRVRSVEGVLSVCIDVGIMVGGRGYLEIKRDGRFVSHVKNLKTKRWAATDLMQEYCHG